MICFKTIPLALALLTLVFISAHPVAADTGKDVVAKVGNITITKQGVQREIEKVIPMQVSFHGGLGEEKLAEIHDQALQTLIERAYKVQYAITEEIAVEPNVMEKEWQSFSSKYASEIAKLSVAQVAPYKADLYMFLLAERAESVAVEQQINVSDTEVESYYQENKENYFKPKLYTASQIFIKVDPSSRKDEIEEKRLRATGLLKRAQEGEDFYNLAYYESDDRSKYVGGSLGSFHAGQTVKEFDDTLNGMKKGEISELVRTMYGFHIIKMDDVQEPRQLNYDEVSGAIKMMLEKQQRDAFYEQWMKANREEFPLEKN